MNKLVLLGIWDELPLFSWPWFADNGIKNFYKLTKIKLKPFTYVKDGLHYQYFVASGVNKLHNYLESLSDKQQIEFVKKICNDYYSKSKKISAVLKKIEKNFEKIPTSKLIKYIQELNYVSSFATIQIWFVVLLDIWYPKSQDKIQLKKIGAKARDHSGHLHDKVKKILKKIVNQISKNIKVKEEDIYYLFPEELDVLIKKKGKEIQQRKKLCVTTNVLGNYSIFIGKKAQQLLEEYLPKPKQTKKKKNVLKGLTASAGKVKGKVKIILLRKQFKDFKQGEILVAFQTMINFVPIMKKAKAILTEYGGITSHAAIVSRELKKPCIVGVANITSTLKNGDYIEVDANKGIVKILKRKRKKS